MLNLEHKKRHSALWRFLRFAARTPLMRTYGYTCETATGISAPYLVVANHNCNLDPALVGLSFPEQMYFVASEHVFRKGLISTVLRYVFNPISRIKGATDASAALDIIRVLKKGYNVCLFGEGNRSFNGLTGPIFPATGKLVRMSGASLVTYRIEGGYLTTPRWAFTTRKGKMLGYIANVYTPEQLNAMTPEAINEAIATDLAEDAFLRQQETPIAYCGDRLAEGLERALFICPVCGKVGTLSSKGDRFYCTCGMETTYLETGFFNEGAPFACVRDWDAWQQRKMADMASGAAPLAPFFDADVSLFSVDAGHGETLLERGAMGMDRQKLRLNDRTFSLKDVSDMALVGAAKIVFSVNGAHYEIKTKSKSFCGRKYVTLYQLLKEA